MCRLTRFFKRGAEEEPKESEERIEVKPKKKARAFRFVNTSRGGPNMPKHQPCPKCRRSVKRDRKVITGAWYVCHHGEFFVRYPRSA